MEHKITYYTMFDGIVYEESAYFIKHEKGNLLGDMLNGTHNTDQFDDESTYHQHHSVTHNIDLKAHVSYISNSIVLHNPITGEPINASSALYDDDYLYFDKDHLQLLDEASWVGEAEALQSIELEKQAQEALKAEAFSVSDTLAEKAAVIGMKRDSSLISHEDMKFLYGEHYIETIRKHDPEAADTIEQSL